MGIFCLPIPILAGKGLFLPFFWTFLQQNPILVPRRPRFLKSRFFKSDACYKTLSQFWLFASLSIDIWEIRLKTDLLPSVLVKGFSEHVIFFSIPVLAAFFGICPYELMRHFSQIPHRTFFLKKSQKVQGQNGVYCEGSAQNFSPHFGKKLHFFTFYFYPPFYEVRGLFFF